MSSVLQRKVYLRTHLHWLAIVAVVIGLAILAYQFELLLKIPGTPQTFR
jgi:carbon starvation protein CstA